MNHVTLLGRLGADVELRYIGSGSAVANVNIATNKSWTGKDGQKQEQTTWHRLVFWGKTAENAERFFHRGDLILVEGEIQNREWEDKDGNKRHTTEIRVERFHFVGSTGSGSGAKSGRDYNPGGEDPPSSFADEDIPF